MGNDGKLILWGILIVLLLIIMGTINPFFADTDYIRHYLYNGLISLSYRSESILKISVLRNAF